MAIPDTVEQAEGPAVEYDFELRGIRADPDGWYVWDPYADADWHVRDSNAGKEWVVQARGRHPTRVTCTCPDWNVDSRLNCRHAKAFLKEMNTILRIKKRFDEMVAPKRPITQWQALRPGCTLPAVDGDGVDTCEDEPRARSTQKSAPSTHLDADMLKVLQYLSHSRVRVMNVELQEKIRRSKATVGKIVKKLLDARLVERPVESRKGVAITDLGLWAVRGAV